MNSQHNISKIKTAYIAAKKKGTIKTYIVQPVLPNCLNF